MFNVLGQLEYRDPADLLRRFRSIEIQFPRDLPDPIRHLRTNELKHCREIREAALFCYGMSCRIGQSVYFSPDERADHDFVAMYVSAGVQHFLPVQLKELVPEQLNPAATIDDIVAGLGKYRSDHLTVAVHLNRVGRFCPPAHRIPALQIAALWFYWATVPDQSEWCLFGDVLGVPQASCFAYPV